MNDQNANNLNQNNVASEAPQIAPESVQVTPVEPVPVAQTENVAVPVVETTTPVQVDAAPVAPEQPVVGAVNPVATVESASTTPSVEVTPVAPVEPAPVMPAAPAQDAPVFEHPAMPAAPVAPAPVMSAAPVEPAPTFVQAAPVNPVNPMGQAVQQPLGAVPVMASEQTTKKKSNLPFIIIVVVLVLIIVGLVVAFVLNNKSKDNDNQSNTETKETSKEETKEKEPAADPVSTSNSYSLEGYTFTFPASYTVKETDSALDIADSANRVAYYLMIDNWYTYDEYKTELVSNESSVTAQFSDYGFTATDRGEKNIGSKTWYVVTGTVTNGATLTLAVTSFNGGTLFITEITFTNDYSTGLKNIGDIADQATSASSFAKGEKPASLNTTMPKIDINLE